MDKEISTANDADDRNAALVATSSVGVSVWPEAAPSGPTNDAESTIPSETVEDFATNPISTNDGGCQRGEDTLAVILPRWWRGGLPGPTRRPGSLRPPFRTRTHGERP